jgi:hypothetical protein
MKKNNIIEDSPSPWSSPVMMVKNNDGKYRFCNDFRKVNAITKKDSYPLPRIEDAIRVL